MLKLAKVQIRQYVSVADCEEGFKKQRDSFCHAQNIPILFSNQFIMLSLGGKFNIILDC